MTIYIRASQAQNEYNRAELKTGWTVKINNTQDYSDVNLDDFHVKNVKRGDWFVLKTTLPADLPDKVGMLIRVPYSATDVYVDGENVYSYGLDDYETNRLLGAGCVYFGLPDGSAGKQLKITMLVTEDRAFSTIDAPLVYDALYGIGIFYRERLLPLTVSITLILAGFTVTIVTFAMYFKSFSIERLLCIGVFSLCIGCWTLCSYNLNFLFTDNLRLKSYLEYFSLYLCPVPMLLYFREDVEKRAKKWETRFYFAAIFILIQLFLITSGLNCFNIIHFPIFFEFYLGLIVCTVIYSSVLIWRDVKSEHKHNWLMWGVAALLLFSLRDIVTYVLKTYTTLFGAQRSYRSYTAAGAFVFIMALMADFVIEIRRSTYMEAENVLLTRLAYNDVLTGLSTRRRIEEVFRELDKSNQEYAIIQFDLNNLKMVNDNLGHEMGDKLIVRFANALREIYCHGETIGRMGGDEFVVIVPDVSEYKLDVTLAKLDMLVEEGNKKSEDIKVSYSCGHCYSEEIRNPMATAVYVEADKRMYVEKEKYYKARGYGRRHGDQQNTGV
ncbi:MAG: GGDEF domain-containing protein [Lachnospiraceae bacterium]|nr:GGDEF domain-containing protein [Lachnospiraceae bacterium]